MVVPTQVLTRGLGDSRVSGAAGYKDVRMRDLVRTSPAEPLNATVGRKLGLSLQCNLEGRSTPKGGRVSPALRVPVVGVDGRPLMPTTPQRARKLLRDGVAEKCWNKLGQFYLQMLRPVGINKQPVCLAIDTGSKWDGMAVVTKKQVLTTAELVLPSGIAHKLEVRRQMRRARRYRKTPRRAKRFDNRRRPEGWIASSQKAKVDFRTKIVDELCRIYPINRFAVEDVRFNHYKKHWGKYFSTVEIGKTRFYEHLQKLGSLSLYDGVQTAEWREKFGLPKNPHKSAFEWDAHASDAVAIGCAEMGCTDPTLPEFWVWKRFQNARRQLHRFEFDKGGVRKRYGGSLSVYPFKKTDVVLWRGKLVRIGGFMDGRISLHEFNLKNKRITQVAKPEECVYLFNQRIFGARQVPIPPHPYG
jgi:hypothetical protein